MASRSLTDVYLLMRSNAIRNRNIYPEEDTSERMHLVSLSDVEEGLNKFDDRIPPPWVDYLDKAQRILPTLNNKINDLKILHSAHLHRSTFDESSRDEIAIDNCTQEISRLFNEIHRLVQIIKSHSSDGSLKEQRLATSVYHSLALSLQEMSTFFKTTQNNYLKEIQSREDRSKTFFENQHIFDDDLYANENDDIDDFFMKTNKVTQQQLLYLEEENTRQAVEREKEVNSIVRSIVDLNKIFKDLSQMVADQGTILDRIDYNVEQTQIEVYEGFQQLKKADAYQRKNRKMCAIITLAASIFVLFFVLILVKT